MNEPAFPQNTKIMLPAGQEVHQGFMGGMTLRDYFAAKAMQGDIAAMVDPRGKRCGIQIDLADDNLIGLGKLYYRMADAMLKARNK